MSYLRVLWLNVRLAALNEAAYRANLLLQVTEIGVRLALALSSVGLVYSHTTTLGGWTVEELLALVGVYTLVEGLVNIVVLPSMTTLMEAIRTGSLDFVLTKPIDAQAFVSGQTVEVWKVIDVFVGMLILIWSLVRLGISASGARFLAFSVMIVAGIAIMYAVLLILATLTFWLIKIDNIMVLFQSLYEAGRWPVTIYPQWLKLSLTFLVPVAFAVTVPTEALIGRLTWSTGGTTVILAAGLLLFGRFLWIRGVQRYSGASS